ncbi:MAG TPA: hypothetical protein VGH95_06700 [Candidatus Aquirickettsiella sp.]|jgi:hypothetical protein
MSLVKTVEDALAQYEPKIKEKSSSISPEERSIIEKLKVWQSDSNSEFKACQCFLGGVSELSDAPSQSKYSDACVSVYNSILKDIFTSKNYENVTNIKKGLSLLNSVSLLNEENFNSYKDITLYTEVSLSFEYLHKAGGFLNQESFNFIIQHSSKWAAISPILRTLRIFNQISNIPQEFYERLLDPDRSPHLCKVINTLNNDNQVTLLYELTLPILDELIELIQQNNGIDLVRRHVNQLLGVRQGDAQHVVNPEQSTHTDSVHFSVSSSAQKLFNRYKNELSDQKVREILNKISDDLANLPDSNKKEAAKKCVQRIAEGSVGTYIDPDSQVSTKQLLILSHLARNDDKNRMGNLEDANKQFIDGLYEIQRGYNLSETGVDNGQGADKPICSAGTFNKLMEKLHGIHSDVKLLFITKATAALKLPIIVREETHAYLTRLSNSKAINELIDQLQREGVEEIWGKIKPQVEARLFEEFKSLYDNKEDLRFTELVNFGIYAPLGDLNPYRQSTTRQEEEYEVQSQGARDRRALTGEAVNASCRQLIVEDADMNPVRDECASDAGTTAEIFPEHSDSINRLENAEMIRQESNVDILFTKQKNDFLLQLDAIYIKGIKLRKNGYEEAANCLEELHKTVKSNADKFFKKEINDQTFKENSLKAILKARPKLEKHRGYKEIVANLLIAVAACIIPYIVTEITYKMLTGSFLFFKPKTDSANKIDILEHAIEAITRSPVV